jgi:hypothetical protein
MNRSARNPFFFLIFLAPLMVLALTGKAHGQSPTPSPTAAAGATIQVGAGGISVQVHDGKGGEETKNVLNIATDKDGDDNSDDAAGWSNKEKMEFVRSMRGGHGGGAEDIAVPIAFFLFLVTVILGAKFLRERTEQRRLEVLKLMIEKGQTVPDQIVGDVLNSRHGMKNGRTPEERRERNFRRGVTSTIVGAGLLVYGISAPGDHQGASFMAILALAIGVSSLLAHYKFSKKSE